MKKMYRMLVLGVLAGLLFGGMLWAEDGEVCWRHLILVSEDLSLNSLVLKTTGSAHMNELGTAIIIGVSEATLT